MPTMNTIGKNISTNINKNHSSDRGQQMIHIILMYVERVRVYKKNIARNYQHAKMHIPLPRLPIPHMSKIVYFSETVYFFPDTFCEIRS